VLGIVLSSVLSRDLFFGGGGTSPKHRNFPSRLSRPDFLFLSQCLCYVTVKVAVSRSRLPVPYGANFMFLCCPRKNLASIIPELCQQISEVTNHQLRVTDLFSKVI